MVKVNGDLYECSACHNVFSSSKCSTSSSVKNQSHLIMAIKNDWKWFGCHVKNKSQLVKRMVADDAVIKLCKTDLQIKHSAADEIQ